jgi:hypothetical protein
MRISVKKDDPGYDPVNSRYAKVYLDGVEQKHCVTADEEEGYIIRYVTDDNGELTIEGDYIKEEKVAGKVKIDIKLWRPAANCWRVAMKLSERLKQDHESGDFGKALEGYAERAELLETSLQEAITELESWWRDRGDYGTHGYEEWIPKLKAAIDGSS